jgi:hypothetical protein
MKYIKAKSHEEYVQSQINTNKAKLNAVWITNDEIDKITSYILDNKIKVEYGVCHGVRNGYEVIKFKELLKGNIFGTEISDTATQFQDVIEWDFHEIKDEWIDKFQFIYSNSIDHSYDFEKCLDQWMKTLTKDGCCFIEWSEDIINPHNISDCFGIEKNDLIKLINSKYNVVETFHVEGKCNRIIIVIKHR